MSSRGCQPLYGLIATGSASCSSSGSNGDGSMVLGLSSMGGATQGRLPPPTPSGRGAFISNLQPIASAWPSIGTTAVPKMNDGSDICLAYQLRGGCWSNCHRAAHHGQQLNPVEIQCLEQYLRSRFTALTAPSPTAPTASGSASGTAGAG